MRNAEIAAALRELGILYELDGADRFRVQAYREAARTVAESPVSIEQLAEEGRLTELPAIGKTLAVKIETLIQTGSIPSADKLKAKFPATLVEVTRVPGMGAKTARRIYDELGVENLTQLKEAAEQGRIAGMRGLGAKTEENILSSLEGVTEDGIGERLLLSNVLPVAEEISSDLLGLGVANRIEIAGSARRWTETCKDLDLIATTDDPAGLVEALATHGLSAESRRGGDAAASVLTHAGLKVDLRIGTEEAFGNLLQHFTGSAEHNVELRERALQRGYSVSEHGVAEVEGKKVHRFSEEAGVYELLGLPYIEPELREGRGEIEAGDTGELPDLVTVDDIRGDLHCHTTLSDGRNSLDQMAEEARRRGYAYLAITDHSASHGFGNHVTEKQLAKRIEEIRAFNESAPRGFRLLAGSEVNIGLDGSLDYPDAAARRAGLGDGKRPHFLRDLGAGDDRARDRGDGEPARRLHRTPHGSAPASSRAVRRGHAAHRRGGCEDRDDDGDQRQSESSRPQRAQRQAGGRGGSADRLHHGRPRHRDARQRPLLRGDSAARVAQRRSGGEHA